MTKCPDCGAELGNLKGGPWRHLCPPPETQHDLFEDEDETVLERPVDGD